MTQPLSVVLYEGDGETDTFQVPFPFISRTHVYVEVNGAAPILPPRWVDGGSVKVSPVPPAGSAIRIYRQTPLDGALVEFQNGSVLTEAELNTAVLQLLYIQQELRDAYRDGLGDAILRLATGNGIDTADPFAALDQLALALLERSVVNDLRARIADIDLNAENILQLAADLTDLSGLADATVGQVNALTQSVINIRDNLLEETARIDNRVTQVRDAANDRIDELRDILDAFDPGAVGEGFATLIAQERAERIAADEAIVSNLSMIGALSPDGNAWILDLDTVRVSLTESLGQRLSVVSARLGDAEAAIVNETAARVTAINTLVADASLLTTRLGEAEADILNERSARLTLESAVADQLSLVQTRIGNAEASVLSLEQAITTLDSSTATLLTAVNARIDDSVAAINAETEARVNALGAVASQIAVVQAAVADNTAAIVNETAARTTAISAEAQARQALAATVGNLDATVAADRQARIAGDAALASTIDGLVVRSRNATREGFGWKDSFDTYTEFAQITADYEGNGFAARHSYTSGDRWLTVNHPATTWLAPRPERGVIIDPEKLYRVRVVFEPTVVTASTIILDAGIRAYDAAGVQIPSPQGNGVYFFGGRRTNMIPGVRYTFVGYFKGLAATTAEANTPANAGPTAKPADAPGLLPPGTVRVAPVLRSAFSGQTLQGRVHSIELEETSSEVMAAVVTERQARIDGNLALATQITGLTAQVDDNAAAILQEASTRADAISAEAQARQVLAARVSSAEGAIQTLSDLFADIDGGIATNLSQVFLRLTDVETGLASAQAGILNESTARIAADNALGAQITAVSTQAQNNAAAIVQEAQARSTAIAAEAQQRQQLAARVTSAEQAVSANESAIQQEQTVRAAADAAFAASLSLIGAKTPDGTAWQLDEQKVRVGGGVSIGNRLSGIDTAIGANAAAIANETSARTTAISAEAQARQALEARVTAAEGGIGSNAAAIASETTARIAADSGLAQNISALQTAVNGQTTTVAQLTESVNGIQGQHAVTVNANGQITGFRLIGGGGQSSFDVLAQNFRLFGPGGVSAGPIFGVSTTLQKATLAGHLVIPAGGFMIIQGPPFGSSNQFVYWYGPSVSSLSQCTEGTALFYIKANGQSYYGGRLNADILKAGATTSTIGSTASVSTGLYRSAGKNRSVRLSYDFEMTVQYFPESPPGPSNPVGPTDAVLQIWRTAPGSSVMLAQQTVVGNVTAVTAVPSQGEPGFSRHTITADITFTDAASIAPGTFASYEARLAQRRLTSFSGAGVQAPVIEQYLTVNVLEDLNS